MSISYKKSGVDVVKGEEFVEEIKNITGSNKSASAIGGFASILNIQQFGYQNPVILASTDGVGTKLKIAIDLNRHENIGIDLVAMCVNDLVVHGGKPIAFLDYFATSKLQKDQAVEIIKSIKKGCDLAGCDLVGGETAEMPGLYKTGDYDLAGFAIGIAEKDLVLPRKDIQKNDVIIGIKSSGIHSNGFSLVRKILKLRKIDLHNDKKLADAVLTPTKIYVKLCLAMLDTGCIKGFAHITGGGLESNISRIVPDNLSAKIDYNNWKMPEIFRFLQYNNSKKQVSDKEMRQTFNCGIGMSVIVSKKDVDFIINLIKTEGEDCVIIGKIV